MKTRKKFAILGLVLMIFADASGRRWPPTPPVPPQGQDELPPGWFHADFGDYSEPGTVLYDGDSGKWSISTYCSSGGIFEDPSGCSHYVYTFLNGDGQITARIHDVGAFVEIRESLDDSLKHVGVIIETSFGRVISPESFARFYGTGIESTNRVRILLPYWLRIERRSNTFMGYISFDGDSWEKIGSTTITMNTKTFYIGIGTWGEAEFDNVKVESGTDGWTISGDNMYSDVSGNVGIGTKSPEAKLHVIRDDVDTGHYDRYISSVIEGTEGRIQLIGKDEGHASASLILTNGQESINSHWSIAHLTSSEENKLLFGHKTTSSSPCDAWSFSRGLMAIDTSGNVGIGTINPQGKLDVNGSIYQSGEDLNADYVFEPGYDLESIDEHSQFMWEHGHLEAIPKAKVDDNGREIVEIGAHQKGIVEELEKAHIYIEQLNNRIKVLEEKLVKLEAVISTQ